MSFDHLHIFVLDEDFIVDCSRVRELGTLRHICLMDFSHSDFAIPIFNFFYYAHSDFAIAIFNLDFQCLDFTFSFWILGVQTSHFQSSVWILGV